MHYSCYGRRSSMESTRVTLKFKHFGSTRLIFLHCHDAHVYVYKCTVAAKRQQKDVIGLYFPQIVVLLLCYLDFQHSYKRVDDQIGCARMASSHAAHETTGQILNTQWLSLWLSGLPFLGSRTSALQCLAWLSSNSAFQPQSRTSNPSTNKPLAVCKRKEKGAHSKKYISINTSHDAHASVFVLARKRWPCSCRGDGQPSCEPMRLCRQMYPCQHTDAIR
jgi:hypothetical protein